MHGKCNDYFSDRQTKAISEAYLKIEHLNSKILNWINIVSVDTRPTCVCLFFRHTLRARTNNLQLLLSKQLEDVRPTSLRSQTHVSMALCYCFLAKMVKYTHTLPISHVTHAKSIKVFLENIQKKAIIRKEMFWILFEENIVFDVPKHSSFAAFFVRKSANILVTSWE